MAKKKPVNGKAKGKRGELEWAAFCRSQGHSDARRTAQYCGNTGDASDVVGLPGIHQEVKRVERLNIDEAMEQAIHDAKEAGNGDIPIVAHRRSRKPWLVTMRAEDWFKLYDLGMNLKTIAAGSDKMKDGAVIGEKGANNEQAV